MSEVNWGSDHLEPPKKRSIPLWVLGCGGGCMFMIGATIVAVIVATPKAKRWVEALSKPEVQWPRLAETLPFDAAPEGFSIARLPVPLIDLWLLRSQDQALTVFVLAADQDESGGPWGQWMSKPQEAPFLAGLLGEIESSEGTLVVQGRELRSVRYARKELPPPVSAPEPPQPPEAPRPVGGGAEVPEIDLPLDTRLSMRLDNESVRGGGISLDVTPEESSERIVVWLLREAEGATVSDDDARAFLAPFHIGPRR